jgi:hypothetical protein
MKRIWQKSLDAGRNGLDEMLGKITRVAPDAGFEPATK